MDHKYKYFENIQDVKNHMECYSCTVEALCYMFIHANVHLNVMITLHIYYHVQKMLLLILSCNMKEAFLILYMESSLMSAVQYCLK